MTYIANFMHHGDQVAIKSANNGTLEQVALPDFEMLEGMEGSVCGIRVVLGMRQSISSHT